jgi:hypothetical protein
MILYTVWRKYLFKLVMHILHFPVNIALNGAFSAIWPELFARKNQ